jgi:hypothetical protein
MQQASSGGASRHTIPHRELHQINQIVDLELLHFHPRKNRETPPLENLQKAPDQEKDGIEDVFIIESQIQYPVINPTNFC